ncbi:hypothetical protein NIES4101_28290 (plasmid) [Calothrix sp. NIES-4101]|nr:hypothetical protein NIES4101_28290 [Calothrix sp. NIES-4101]
MNPAQELLEMLVKSAEGTRKQGFTVGGVTFTLNQANDQITGNFTIPVTTIPDENGFIKVTAEDFLEFQVVTP